MATVRICVCGDESVGKSSLIVSLVKDRFVAHRIQSVLPPITLPPPPPPAPDPQVTTTVVDTSARPQDRAALGREIRKCNVILLLYASSYSFERVALFWMPYLRSLGVSVPVVLCCSKADLQPGGRPEEMQPVMDEFKEVDSCIRASAREAFNVVEAFWLCQRAVLHPIAPLFDHKTGRLKPKCAAALCRIFFLSDEDQDGLLGDREMARLQSQCFGKALPPEELEAIKRAIMVPAEGAEGVAAAAAAARGEGLGGGGDGPGRHSAGIDIDGFLRMHEMYVRRGRPETVWGVLRKYRYNDSLGLEDKFLHPRLNVAEFASAELSPAGYRFFVDLFLLFDRDNDGGLNDGELAALFRPTPGIPSLWADSGFPATTVRDEAGHVTLQGWLAQWSMTTFLEPQTTLEYLAYLGFGDPDERDPTSAAIKVTRPRRRGRHQAGGRQRMMRPARGAAAIDRSVVHCYLVGSPGSGKSSLLDAFLGRPFNPLHAPTITPRRAVNTVELPGGRQVYLILEELGRLETAILDNQARLDGCDLVCLAYDSSDPESFGHLVELRARHRPALDDVPAVYAALKADRDKTMQNAERQPDAYAAALGVPAPRHVSVVWGDSIGELFVALAEAATTGLPLLVGSEGVGEGGAEGGRVGPGSGPDRTSLYFATGAVACATVAALVIWRRGGGVIGPS